MQDSGQEKMQAKIGMFLAPLPCVGNANSRLHQLSLLQLCAGPECRYEFTVQQESSMDGIKILFDESRILSFLKTT